MSALQSAAMPEVSESLTHPSPGEGDPRSVRLKDEIAREWKQMKRTASPGERELWIKRQETIVGMAARQRAQILQGLAYMREELQREVPSASWFDSAWDDGEPFPPGAGQTSMVKSRAKTRIGMDGKMSRRFTPPQCQGEEDFIDRMSIDEATYKSCVWPGSISALVIIRIGHFRSVEEGG